MEKLKHILFNDEKLIKFLEKKAKEELRSFSNLVTFILTKYMEENEKTTTN